MLSESWNMLFIWFLAINIFRTGQLIVQHCRLTCFEGKAEMAGKKPIFFPKEDLNLIFFSLIPFPFFILNQQCILFKWRVKSLLSGLDLLYLIKRAHFLNHKHDPRKSLLSTSWCATSALISSGTSPPLLPPDYLCGSLCCWKSRSWEENHVFLVGKHEIQLGFQAPLGDGKQKLLGGIILYKWAFNQDSVQELNWCCGFRMFKWFLFC